MQKEKIHKKHFIETFAWKVTTLTGSTGAIVLAFGSVLAWFIAGSFFHYSNEWMMVMNTGTAIVTFLVVFLIQKAQNKDSLAIQLKLNELLAAHELASNKMVSVEDMTEEELKIIQKYYHRLRDFEKRAVGAVSLQDEEQIPEIKKVKMQMDKMLANVNRTKRKRKRRYHNRKKAAGNHVHP